MVNRAKGGKVKVFFQRLHMTMLFFMLVYNFKIYISSTPFDTPPNSLMDSIASRKVKTTKRKRVGVRSLTYSTLGVEGRVGVLGWGLRRLTNNSITHMDLHKLNNKLVNA
jgi:hypothetical protein